MEEASLIGVLRTRREWSRRGWESQRSRSKGTLGSVLILKKHLTGKAGRGAKQEGNSQVGISKRGQ